MRYVVLQALVLAMFGAAPPVLASITYSCDPNIDATQAGTCSALNGSTVSGVYGGIFSDVSANIYIQYGAAGIGSSSFNVTPVTYSQYYSALPAYSASLLPGTDPLLSYGSTSGNIDVTAALASALSLTQNGASTAGVEADGVTSCTLGTSGCYNGVITMSNTPGGFYYPLSPSDPVQSGIDFFYIVEHETDEILGTSSCLVTDSGAPGDQCGGTDAAPADLFRFAASGTRTFLTTANGTTAYFSINGGVTVIDQYVNAPIGLDYGDWMFVGGPYQVQDAIGSPGANVDITTDGGAEITALNAVGFNLAVPEPCTIGLLGVGLAALAWRRRHQV